MSDQFSTPEWVKDAVFYQIFPDRFAKSSRVPKPKNLEPWRAKPTEHGFKGGDLLGVLERLDYLQDLGITAIYFNPIFQSASNHRYHTHDYYQIDPLLGGNKAFFELLNEIHNRDMRVILDGVFNHASRGFFQFNHILETGSSSPFLDWFMINKFPLNAYHSKPNYSCWWGLPALPEFNTDNPQVRNYIFDVARFWIDAGIDGWRLDVPEEIDDGDFWREFRQVVKTSNPNAYLVGEIPGEAQRWLSGDKFDAVMNYQFTQACLGFFAGNRIDREIEKGMMGLKKAHTLDADGFSRRVEALLHLYHREAALAQLNILDSHDTPRFITLAGGDKSSLMLAILFQMTYPGTPCIYYGDEIGMQGGSSECPEPSRAGFIWEETRWDNELRNFIKSCIAVRKAHPALRRGDFIPLHNEGKLLSFLRQLSREQIVVVINNDDHITSINIPANGRLTEGSLWKDLLTGKTAKVNSNYLTGISILPRSGCVLSLSN